MCWRGASQHGCEFHFRSIAARQVTAGIERHTVAFETQHGPRSTLLYIQAAVHACISPSLKYTPDVTCRAPGSAGNVAGARGAMLRAVDPTAADDASRGATDARSVGFALEDAMVEGWGQASRACVCAQVMRWNTLEGPGNDHKFHTCPNYKWQHNTFFAAGDSAVLSCSSRYA